MNSALAKELELHNISEIIPINIDEEKEVTMEDFFATSTADLEAFDANAWNKGDGLTLPNYPYITEQLEGLDSGLYLFAGKSNHGKSAAMMNIMEDACSYAPNKRY